VHGTLEEAESAAVHRTFQRLLEVSPAPVFRERSDSCSQLIRVTTRWCVRRCSLLRLAHTREAHGAHASPFLKLRLVHTFCLVPRSPRRDRQDRGKVGSPRLADHGLAAGLRSLQADNEETEVFAFQAEVRRRRRPAAALMRDASRWWLLIGFPRRPAPTDQPASVADHQHLLLQQGDLPARAHLERIRCARQDPLRGPHGQEQVGGAAGAVHPHRPRQDQQHAHHHRLRHRHDQGW
jgi:hypothetical protein